MDPRLPSSHQLHICEFAEDFIVFYLHLARLIDANPADATIPFFRLKLTLKRVVLNHHLIRSARDLNRVPKLTILKGVNNMVIFDNKITADVGGRCAFDCNLSGIFNRVVFYSDWVVFYIVNLFLCC